jgi:hypothetical protein
VVAEILGIGIRALSHNTSQQVLWWAIRWINDDVEERRERGEMGCKLTVSLGTRTKDLCERDK